MGSFGTPSVVEIDHADHQMGRHQRIPLLDRRRGLKFQVEEHLVKLALGALEAGYPCGRIEERGQPPAVTAAVRELWAKSPPNIGD